MNHIAGIDFEKSDKKLNDVYKKIAATLDAAGKEKLIASESAWLVYRETQAEFEADYFARGGNMATLIYSEARARITDTRIKELKDALSVKE